jgi:hypothetical protein
MAPKAFFRSPDQFFKLEKGAIKIIRDTLGGRGAGGWWLAKVSPNITMGGGGVGKNVT